jgi:DNA-binding transcriptional LysR family regulator
MPLLECAMTLTQLNAFVLVARLGSVRAAAAALGVSESAVSQALTALREDFGDKLITRSQAGMTLTPGGSRLLGTASQIVVLGAEAYALPRARPSSCASWPRRPSPSLSPGR